MEQITITQLINELATLKKMHGDLKICHIAYGAIEKVYSVRVDTAIKKETKEKEKVILLY